MSTEDAFKAAEQRGYAKGYAAGHRRKVKELAVDRRRARERAFEQRAFLAVLPWVFQQDAWGMTGADGKVVPYKSLEERVKFAWNIAERSLQQGVNRGVV